MTDLDDSDALERADPGGMARAVAGSAAQVREAAIGPELARLASGGRPRALVCLGMGGSGIAGDVLAAVAGPGCPVPISTHKGYGLPGWVGGADVVIAVSCSGRTEETLSGLAEAVQRGCRIAAVGAPDSPLHALAERGGGGFVPVTAPGRAPRASLWALAVPVLLIARDLGLLALDSADLAATADRLEALALTCRSASEAFMNPAKELAQALAGRLPLVWGASPLAGVAALRLHCQLAENAGVASVLGVLPEVTHNLIMIIDETPATPPAPALVLLRDAPDADPAQVRRAEACAELAADRSVPVHQLVAEGRSRLERLASLIGLADWVSVYLALLRGVDPTPVGAIEHLKSRLTAPPR